MVLVFRYYSYHRCLLVIFCLYIVKFGIGLDSAELYGKAGLNIATQNRENCSEGLQLISDPAGATITIDGKMINKKTPTTLRGIPIGNHRIKLKKKNYHDINTTLIFTWAVNLKLFFPNQNNYYIEIKDVAYKNTRDLISVGVLRYKYKEKETLLRNSRIGLFYGP